jgi:parallel beta-helix repeat protein
MFRRKTLALAIALCTLLLLAGAPALAKGRKPIVVKTTIQAAIDAAQPGDTILVPRGTYAECPVLDEDDITIVGARGAVIDATGCSVGLRVGTGQITTDPNSGEPVCPPIEIEKFTLKGLTIENADFSGIFIIGATNFRVSAGKYVANGEYGIFPRCSTHGLIDWNIVDGAQVARDAGIYVGVDQDVDVRNNFVTGSPIGIEVENSLDTDVRFNLATGNTSAILVVILPGLPNAATEGVRIEGNLILENNLTNPFAPGDPDDIALIPTGTGILNVGGDGVLIQKNVIKGNDTLGVAILANPFSGEDPRIEPLPDDGVVRNNVIVKNGRNPDPARPGTPSADIVYDGSSPTQCFANNVFETDFPPGITGLFPCP